MQSHNAMEHKNTYGRCNKNQIQTFGQRLKCFILMAMWFDTFNISKK